MCQTPSERLERGLGCSRKRKVTEHGMDGIQYPEPRYGRKCREKGRADGLIRGSQNTFNGRSGGIKIEKSSFAMPFDIREQGA